MVKYIIFLLSLLSVVLGFDCKKNPTCPPNGIPADTTSNNFIFQQFSFGGNTGSSMLNDVAIVSDSNIWAVGAIYLDSANGNPDPIPYNVVHWNGNEWSLAKVPYNYQGQLFYHAIECIFAFNENDIWLAGNGIQHWDGSHYNEIDLPISLWGQHRINKLGGISSSNLYIVGDSGSIALFSAGTWQKLPTLTTLNLTDIWCGVNSATGHDEILAVANNLGGNFSTSIISITGNTATQVSSSPITYPLSTVWFDPGYQYYVGGSGIYEKNELTDSMWKNGMYDISQYYINLIRGNNANDVFAVGAYGEFVHYNGVRWHSFKDQTSLASGVFGAIAVKGNLTVAVGFSGAQGVIEKGIRR